MCTLAWVGVNCLLHYYRKQIQEYCSPWRTIGCKFYTFLLYIFFFFFCLLLKRYNWFISLDLYGSSGLGVKAPYQKKKRIKVQLRGSGGANG